MGGLRGAYQVIDRKRPYLTDDPDYSRVFYPDPPSHDACIFLIIAELMRRVHDAPSPLRVKLGLIAGQLGMVDFGPLSLLGGHAHPLVADKAYSDEMILNVIQPAIEMIGGKLESPMHFPFVRDGLRRYCEYDYHIAHLVDAAREGCEVPRWTVRPEADWRVEREIGGRPIVITLRESSNQPERNSNVVEWLNFAEYAKGCGYDVLFVRDTAKAMEQLPFPTYPPASYDARIRYALYERALVNLSVCTGPTVWMMFGHAPYLMFKQLIPALPEWDHGNAKGWREQDHMEIGQQWPWAYPTQRLTWADDTAENIRLHFDDLLDSLPKM